MCSWLKMTGINLFRTEIAKYIHKNNLWMVVLLYCFRLEQVRNVKFLSVPVCNLFERTTHVINLCHFTISIENRCGFVSSENSKASVIKISSVVL